MCCGKLYWLFFFAGNDIEALFSAFIQGPLTAVFSEQDIIDCAAGNGTDPNCTTPNLAYQTPAIGQTQMYSLTLGFIVPCDSGAIVITVTIKTTVDDTDTEVSSTDAIVNANYHHCTITGDFLDTGPPDQMITLNGNFVFHQHAGVPSAIDPDIQKLTGTVFLATDFGTGVPFWTDQVTNNAFLIDDGISMFTNGGICLGSTVIFGPNNQSDNDDGCGPFGDVFTPTSDI